VDGNIILNLGRIILLEIEIKAQIMDLQLQTIAAQEFAFLKSEYGFKCVKNSPWLVRYESDVVFINIYFDWNRSYEFGCELGRNDNLRGSLKVPFDIGEIIRSKGNSDEHIGSSFQVTSRDSLEKFAKELASSLKYYAHEFLRGSSDAFNQVADLRDKECKEYALEKELRLMRSKLGDAWHNKDYQKVIELLSPLREKLRESELKKLKYALKKGTEEKRSHPKNKY
jgi:hypothetical protein